MRYFAASENLGVGARIEQVTGEQVLVPDLLVGAYQRK
jgi:hypothetical protein